MTGHDGLPFLFPPLAGLSFGARYLIWRPQIKCYNVRPKTGLNDKELVDNVMMTYLSLFCSLSVAHPDLLI